MLILIFILMLLCAYELGKFVAMTKYYMNYSSLTSQTNNKKTK